MPRPTLWPFIAAAISINALRHLSGGGATHNARTASQRPLHHKRQVQELRDNLIDRGLTVP